MTVAEILKLKANAGGLNLYLPAAFATDSKAHSLAADEQYITHCLPGGGFVVLPLERLLEAYPLTVDEPPPGTFRRVLDDDTADFERIPFTRTDVRDYRDELNSTDSPNRPAESTPTHRQTQTQTQTHE
jgi:hypothetical protein